MTRLTTFLLALLLGSTFAASQQSQPEKGQAETAPSSAEANDGSRTQGQNAARSQQEPRFVRAGEIPANAEIHATLDTPLASRTARAGDRFTATVSQPIHDVTGVASVPAGSKLMGEIADNSQALPSRRTALILRFNEITLPNGQKIPIVSSLSVGGDRSEKNTELNLPAQTPLVLHLEEPTVVPDYGRQ